MTENLPSLGRRRALTWLCALPACGLPPMRHLATSPAGAQTGTLAAPFPDAATITVAGPAGGTLDSWSRALQPALLPFLPAGMALRRTLAGGIDGITGANQFAAQALPDGSAALLMPGTAALRWLLNDPSVQFDVGRWIPLLGGLSSAVIVGRTEPVTWLPGQRLRVAVPNLHGPEVSVVLGLERLGLSPVPVSGPSDLPSILAALAQHTADLALVRGADIPMALATAGLRPLCVLGVPDGSDTLGRDPSLPDIPHLGELRQGMPADLLTSAWRALVVASQLVFGLVLPQLTAAALVALWRRAIEEAVVTEELRTMAESQSVRLYPNPGIIGAIAISLDAAAALQDWLARRPSR